MQATTDFGFQQVPLAEKTEKVKQVFESVAKRYDIMNDVMSFGTHRFWKQFTVNLAKIRPGQTVLDIAGGTGDLTAKFARLVGQHGQVILLDINSAMLQQGRSRLWNQGLVGNIAYIQANAEMLPLQNSQFDCISIAFGLRNVTDKPKALREMYRVVKPGGQLLVLEFSKPVLPLLTRLYDAYSFNIIPKLGKWITGDTDSYQYLVESIRMHPDQATLKTMLATAGFDHVDIFNLSGGIVALHRAYKY